MLVFSSAPRHRSRDCRFSLTHLAMKPKSGHKFLKVRHCCLRKITKASKCDENTERARLYNCRACHTTFSGKFFGKPWLDLRQVCVSCHNENCESNQARKIVSLRCVHRSLSELKTLIHTEDRGLRLCWSPTGCVSPRHPSEVFDRGEQQLSTCMQV